uniref:Histidinol-phosphatase n=1 Tax=uncultured Helicobacter sp. TaxID=175537 RepID=A0A650EKQ9_9HELI|nr:putative histidinol-phosphatase [uncultured Helicobacter sp.]
MHIDLHNHTIFCHHATGCIDEYIQAAIAQGIDVYGFSCHSPMSFDKNFRMNLEEFSQYCQMLQTAKAHYADKIEILLGMEVDYILNHENLIEQAVLDYPFDYLIGSVHFLDDWGFDNPAFIKQYSQRNIEECWEQYLLSITKMAQSGLFQIVGHFDLLKIFGHKPKDIHQQSIKDALESIADNHLAIELNSAGWRKPIKESYPSKEILTQAFQLNIPITFGSDAHSVKQVGFKYQDLRHLALEVGYTQAVFFRQKQSVVIDI